MNNDFSLTEEQLVNKYYYLVKKIAKYYLNFSIDPIEDLIQVGLIALVKAYRKFDKNKNIKIFENYATLYIKGYIRHYLRDKQNILRLSNNKIKEITIIWIDNDKKDEKYNNKNQYILENEVSFQENIENKIFLDSIISKLDDKKKNIIKLRYFYNLTQNELSKIIGVSQMEVSRLLKKIEKEIRELIKN